MVTMLLDPSLRYFGVTIIDDKGVVRGAHCFETTTKMTDVEAVQYISDSILALVRQHKPAGFVIESFVGSKSQRAAVSLAFVQGAVIGILRSAVPSTPVTYISATNVRKKLGLVRTSTKEDVADCVHNLYPSLINFTQKKKKPWKEAMTDSCALAVCV